MIAHDGTHWHQKEKKVALGKVKMHL